MLPELPGQKLELERSEKLEPLRRIAQNIFSLAAADIGNKILLFLFFIITARYLGPNDFGVFSLAMAITNILVVFADFGTSSLGVREAARDYGIIKRFISNIVFIKIIFSIIVILGGWFVVKILGYPTDKIHAIALLFPSIVFFTFTQSFNAVFQATEKMFYIPLGKLIDGLILIVGAFLLVHFKASTNSFIFLYTFAVFMVFFYSLTIIWSKFTRFTITGERSFIKQILKDAFPFGLSVIFSTLYYWNSSAFLSLWKGNVETGLFTAPLRLVLGTTFIPTAFVGAIYPILSRTFVSSQGSMENILERALKYMLIIAVPLCLFTALSAQKVITFFYGNNYLLSTNLLRILIWWAGLIYINAVFAHFFYSINRQSTIAYQTFFAMVLNLVLNVMLIKNYGAWGASISVVAAEFLSLVYLLVQLLMLNSSNRKILDRLALTLLKSVVAFILPFIVMVIGKQLNILVLFLISLILYVSVFIWLKGLSNSDLDIIKYLWTELKLAFYGKT